MSKVTILLLAILVGLLQVDVSAAQSRAEILKAYPTLKVCHHMCEHYHGACQWGADVMDGAEGRVAKSRECEAEFRSCRNKCTAFYR